MRKSIFSNIVAKKMGFHCIDNGIVFRAAGYLIPDPLDWEVSGVLMLVRRRPPRPPRPISCSLVDLFPKVKKEGLGHLVCAYVCTCLRTYVRVLDWVGRSGEV